MVKPETLAIVTWPDPEYTDGFDFDGPYSLDRAIEEAKRMSSRGHDATVYKLTETHYFKAVVK